MGAWPRHPCRGHPAMPAHPAADRFLRSATHGREKEDQKQKRLGWPLSV